MKKFNIKSREIKLIATMMVVGFALGWLVFGTSDKGGADVHDDHAVTSDAAQIYTCSMHPQIRQDKPGLCPICAMELVPVASSGNADEVVNPNEIQLSASALALASVQTTMVTKGAPEKEISLLGKVQADERRISEITARFGGRIEDLYINYTGQLVKKGQKLGTIYSPELITAQKELLEASKYKDSNPSFYKAARTKLKLWDLTEDQIAALESDGTPQTMFEILSPITGTVTNRNVSIGDYVKEGALLFEVIDLSKVWVMFDAYESDLPWIKKGDKVNFTLQSVPGKNFEGKVADIDPFIDAKTRVAKVRVELGNPGGQLKPEMFANGVLTSVVAQNANELLIPKSAILWTGKRSVIYVKVRDREAVTFVYREIELGSEAGDYYVVVSGLDEGEVIASNGVFRIDAAAQLEGKQSMMNPTGGQVSTGHQHGDMPMEESKGHKEDVLSANADHQTFKVWGNCSMCEETIETAVLGLKGISKADWDQETKMIKVAFNQDVIKLGDIHKAISGVGYDTELEKADDDVYKNLPACCQYERE